MIIKSIKNHPKLKIFDRFDYHLYVNVFNFVAPCKAKPSHILCQDHDMPYHATPWRPTAFLAVRWSRCSRTSPTSPTRTAAPTAPSAPPACRLAPSHDDDDVALCRKNGVSVTVRCRSWPGTQACRTPPPSACLSSQV